ncbi:hypothetical protein [Novosphingobium aquae]|uniref:Glycine zipper domain-containing protein n=1 Tax=Novosphingobium aquae TaxID=3133435 RepID=A0ABU8SC37_9SPHN
MAQRTTGRVAYDPVVIQSYADALYRAADRIAFNSAIIGGLIGAAVGFAAGSAGRVGPIGGLIGAAIGGYIGYSRALARTFQLRLEAQLALCQVEIEMNTRGPQ